MAFQTGLQKLAILASIVSIPTAKIVAQKPAPSPTPDKGKQVAALEAKLADLRIGASDLGDYVPCVFTKEELLSLRQAPVSPRLTSAQDETLKSNVLAVVLAQKKRGQLDPETAAAFVERLSKESFVDLTPSQALTRIILDLRESIRGHVDTAALTQAANSSGSQPLLDLLTAKMQQVTRSQDLRTQLLAQLKKAPPDFANITDPWAKLGIAAKWWSDLAANLADTKNPLKIDMSNGLKSDDLGSAATEVNKFANKLQQTSVMGEQETAQQSIVESARKTIGQLARPPDVGCAMSILGWSETRYAFGSLIADEYIAIQVVVRNLNPDKEFLLHDAEVAVDSDPTGIYGRYFSGRDKIIVRAVANAQRSFSRRNFLVHTAEGIGAIMSAVIPIWDDVQGIASASSVFNSAFLPGLRSVWTDLTTDQLNLVSDIGFSSSTTYKTVVPKSGAAMFVVFVPARQFEEGWWVQDCAHRSFLNLNRINKNFPSGQQVGVDLDAALGYCALHPPKPDCYEFAGAPSSPDCKADGGQVKSEITVDSHTNTESWTVTNGNTTTTTKYSEDRTTGDVNQTITVTKNGETSTASFRGPAAQIPQPLVSYTPKRVPYHNWRATSLALFRELVFTVVAGTHIQEQNQNIATVDQLTCPQTNSGDLDLNTNTNNNFLCTVTGQGLEKASLLRLRNLHDSTDTKTADGSVTVNGDSNSANITFAVKDLVVLQAAQPKDYKVYTVTKDGVENDTGRVEHLSAQGPVLTDAQPNPANITSDAITLSGFNLDQLNDIKFKCPLPPCTEVTTASLKKPTTPTSAAVDLTQVKGDFTAGPSFQIIVIDAQKNEITTNKTMILKGKR